MKSMLIKSVLLTTSAAILLAACQKEELQAVDSEEQAVEEEIVPGNLISATKVASVSAETACYDLGPAEFQTSKVVELLKKELNGYELFHFDIVTYRIKYWTKTLVNGEPQFVQCAGDVSFIADSTGRIKTRHLESVTLFNTIFNTSQYDTELAEYFYINLRTIYNALVVFPFYQGGSYTTNEDKKPDISYFGEIPTYGENINVLTSEYIIKAKQAIDCERAALKFIEQLEGVEMMKGYYTENIGVSNGGGPALAVPYVLQNDEEYKAYNETINLRSTYVGAGSCSNKALVENLKNVTEESAMWSVAPVGYITTVEGAYSTWGDKKFSGIDDDTEYFAESLFNMRFIMTDDENFGVKGSDYLTWKWCETDTKWQQNKTNKDNTATPYQWYKYNWNSLFYYCNGLTLKNTINSGIYKYIFGDTKYKSDRQKKATEKMMNALLAAFEENDKIGSGWTPESQLLIAHSEGDEFLPYSVNYKIWENLSNDGRCPWVRFENMGDLSHGDSSSQAIINILLNKHPFSGIIRIDYDDVYSFLGQALL